jgi:hypothetical protein
MVLSVAETESVTVNVTDSVSKVVGVPLIVPVVGFNDRPAGRLGVDVQVYGAVPPEACKVAEYGKPTGAVGKDVVTIDNPTGAAVMVIARFALPVPPAFVALI